MDGNRLAAHIAQQIAGEQSYGRAVRQMRLQRREGRLVCPHCHAANRPGATVIELDADGWAACGVCRYGWSPEMEDLARGYLPLTPKENR